MHAVNGRKAVHPVVFGVLFVVLALWTLAEERTGPAIGFALVAGLWFVQLGRLRRRRQPVSRDGL